MTINIGLAPATGHRRHCRQHSLSLILHLLFYGAIFLQLFCAASIFVAGQGQVEPAVRVVRFQVDYPEAQLDTVRKLPNWTAVMRKSVLASLRFVNKHWLICGEAREPDEPTTSNGGQQQPQQPSSTAEGGGGKEKSGTDCGKLQVTGEPLGANRYRVNATFIASRDPVRNAKVEANSTVQSVLQIGLKGGIFQYTNAMKVLGKPSQEMVFEEAYFCYPGQEQADSGGDECKPSISAKSSRQKKSAEPEGPLAPPPRPSS